MAESKFFGVFRQCKEVRNSDWSSNWVLNFASFGIGLNVFFNAVCRFLQNFVEKHGTGIEVLYTLAGWMKNDPSLYRVRLASKPTLAG